MNKFDLHDTINDVAIYIVCAFTTLLCYYRLYQIWIEPHFKKDPVEIAVSDNVRSLEENVVLLDSLLDELNNLEKELEEQRARLK